MGLFSRQTKKSGWMAISFQTDGIYAAYAQSAIGSRPTIEWLSFYPSAGYTLAASLDKLEKEHKTVGYQCTNLLAIGEYQMLSVDAPPVPANELKSAVRWRLKDMLDYPVDDATIDVLSVPADKGLAARNSTLFAIAARNQLIQKRQAQFDEAKLALQVIDVPDMAQRNISALLEPEGRAVALLSVNDDGTLVTVTCGGELYFSRHIDIAAGQLRDADYDAISAFHERITLELQRSMDYFDRQYHSTPLSKLVLAPMEGLDEPLRDYLSANLYVPVETLDLASVLDLSGTPELKSKDLQQRYFLVIGAALRQEVEAP
jgi:MSHA biogenesis protein MshI